MPRNTQKQSADTREPDDMKETERTAQVGRRSSGEYEDIEDSRTKSSARRGNEDEEGLDEIDDADIVEEVDLDAAPEGDGPDA
jgi:hypothetical protein